MLTKLAALPSLPPDEVGCAGLQRAGTLFAQLASAPCRLQQSSTWLAAIIWRHWQWPAYCFQSFCRLIHPHCMLQHIESLCNAVPDVLTSQSSTRLLAQPSSMAFCLRRWERLVRALWSRCKHRSCHQDCVWCASSDFQTASKGAHQLLVILVFDAMPVLQPGEAQQVQEPWWRLIHMRPQQTL